MKKWLSALSFAAVIAAAPAFAQGQSNDQAVGQSEGRPIQLDRNTHLTQKNFRPGNNSKHNPPPVNDSVPMFSYSFLSSIDQNTYTGKMVGGDPATTGTTTVPTVIIPVRLNFQLSRTTTLSFDPTASDDGCIGAGNTALTLTQASPLFGNADYIYDGTPVGSSTQYVDAYQRANFWPDVANNPGYHTLLGTAIEPLQTVNVSSRLFSTSGAVYTFANPVCGSNTGNTNPANDLGVVNINTFDPAAQSILNNLKLQPGTFAVFLLYNAVLSNGNASNIGNCCILGYHNVISTTGQTYAVAEFEGREGTVFSGVGDITAMSHEIGEWMDDPLGTNPTPAWGHVGQVSNCQSNLENGDPLSGTQFPAITMPNGFTYHPQELAFAAWFFRTPAPLPKSTWFSNNGTFTQDAGAVCH